jgi:hypothetical protein
MSFTPHVRYVSVRSASIALTYAVLAALIVALSVLEKATPEGETGFCASDAGNAGFSIDNSFFNDTLQEYVCELS